MEAEPLMYMGDWPRVVKVVEKDLPAALKIGNWFVATYVCSWAAFAYLKMRRVEDARRMIDQGGECLTEASTDSRLATYVPIMRSSVRLKEGDIAGAEQEFAAKIKLLKDELEEKTKARDGMKKETDDTSTNFTESQYQLKTLNTNLQLLNFLQQE